MLCGVPGVTVCGPWLVFQDEKGVSFITVYCWRRGPFVVILFETVVQRSREA